MTSILFNLAQTDKGEFITATVGVETFGPAPDTHPNFAKIKAAALAAINGIHIHPETVTPLFDIAKQVEIAFKRLTERVTISGGKVRLDGDPVDGPLQDQILEFVEQGEDFGPLVAFYEKLLTNPLGDVRESLYAYLQSQRGAGHGFAITPDGDVLGYKSVKSASPEWREDHERVYVPSQRGEGIVNGVEVDRDKFIEQVPGDLVEMPRSRVLHAPSAACGDGLHVGTYGYASTFYGGDTVMLVRFSPRDIVSVPSSSSTWKIRVCRYTVVGIVDSPVQEAVHEVPAPTLRPQTIDDPYAVQVPDEDESEAGRIPLKKGERVVDIDGDPAVTVSDEYNGPHGPVVDLRWDNRRFGQDGLGEGMGAERITRVEDFPSDEEDEVEDDPQAPRVDEIDIVFSDGERVVDEDGDEGTVRTFDDGSALVEYDHDGLADADLSDGNRLDNGGGSVKRIHGKGGPTSLAAKGSGRNPAQDELGRFSSGRPGSERDTSTGRFTR